MLSDDIKKSFSNDFSNNLEVEMKFIIADPEQELQQTLLKSQNSILIQQFLYSASFSKQVLAPFLELHPGFKEFIDDFDFNAVKARIRNITKNAKTMSILGFKGSKEKKFKALGVSAKKELEVEIQQSLRDYLFQLAVESKQIVHYETKTRISLKSSARIDFDIVNNVNGVDLKPKFVVAEIELDPHQDIQEQIQDLRSKKLELPSDPLIGNFYDLNPKEVRDDAKSIENILVSSRSITKAINNAIGIPSDLQNYFR